MADPRQAFGWLRRGQAVALLGVALLTSGCTLWGWGSDANGQLGDGGTNTNKTIPVRIGSATDWLTTSDGDAHVCGIRYGQNTLWCWGSDFYGQLGDGGTNTDKASPVQVGTATDWSSVNSGGLHSCGVRTNGTLWCWGSDFYGQLGDGGTNTDKASPVQVGTATNWSSVDSGTIHSCGVRTNGTLWCWGSDSSGQLGDGGTNTDKASPVQVGTATNWSSVDSGGLHSCAVRTNGTLWCWGSDLYGQLGDGGTNTDKASPVQVGTATNWTSVSSGSSHTCGVRTNDTLWCWGYDQNGELGDGGTNTNKASPVQIGTAALWRSVDSGGFHTCAIRTNDTLWCWGDDTWGQLGDGGTDTDKTSPVQVGTLARWHAVSTGASHTHALLKPED